MTNMSTILVALLLSLSNASAQGNNGNGNGGNGNGGNGNGYGTARRNSFANLNEEPVNVDRFNFAPANSPRVEPGKYVIGLKNASCHKFVKKLVNGNHNTQSQSSNAKVSWNNAMLIQDMNDEERNALIHKAGGCIENVLQDFKIEANEVQQNPPSWGLDRSDQVPAEPNGAYRRCVGPTPDDYNGVEFWIADTGCRMTDSAVFSPDQIGVAVDCTDGTCATPGQFDTDVGAHGTHCASTAASPTYGIAGGIKVNHCKVLGDNGSGSFSWLWACLETIAIESEKPGNEDKRYVVNLSLGAVSCSYTQAADIVNFYVQEKDLLIVIAAGNDGIDAECAVPANAALAMTVGAAANVQQAAQRVCTGRGRNRVCTDVAAGYADVRASFSNYGAVVDIFAPGVGITGINGATGSAAIWSGTSMAAPHVAGACALAWSKNTGLTAQQVMQIVKDNSLDEMVDLNGSNKRERRALEGTTQTMLKTPFDDACMPTFTT
eukprot:115392_1